MDILFIGGTSFIGRQAVEAALARGHRVTVFHRGITGAELFAGSEHILGDRNRDLHRLVGRRWDAAVDVFAFLPRQVEQATSVLARSVGVYCYVSSVMAYQPGSSVPLTEESPIYGADDFADPATEVVDEVTYGPLKALGEAVAERNARGRTLIVRPTFVIGPYDSTDRFTYWVRRTGAGGTMLAAGPFDAPIQLIDVRDLAAFLMTLLEQGALGPFNAVGPDWPITRAEMLAVCAAAQHASADITWVDPAFLHERGVNVRSAVPFWRQPSESVLMQCGLSKACAAGLTLRSLAESVCDTRAWDIERGDPPLQDVLTGPRERDLLEDWNSSAG